MILAHFAKISIDPENVLKSRWVHDAAHAFLAAKRRVDLFWTRASSRRARATH